MKSLSSVICHGCVSTQFLFTFLWARSLIYHILLSTKAPRMKTVSLPTLYCSSSGKCKEDKRKTKEDKKRKIKEDKKKVHSNLTSWYTRVLGVQKYYPALNCLL